MNLDITGRPSPMRQPNRTQTNKLDGAGPVNYAMEKAKVIAPVESDPEVLTAPSRTRVTARHRPRWCRVRPDSAIRRP